MIDFSRVVGSVAAIESEITHLDGLISDCNTSKAAFKLNAYAELLPFAAKHPDAGTIDGLHAALAERATSKRRARAYSQNTSGLMVAYPDLRAKIMLDGTEAVRAFYGAHNAKSEKDLRALFAPKSDKVERLMASIKRLSPEELASFHADYTAYVEDRQAAE